jgi:hypothetical protein
MLEAILKISKSPSDKELRAARIESIKQQIIGISKYRVIVQHFYWTITFGGN